MPVEPVNLKRNLILPKANENYNRESNEATTKSTIGNQRSYGGKKCCYLRERERDNSLGILGFLFFKVK